MKRLLRAINSLKSREDESRSTTIGIKNKRRPTFPKEREKFVREKEIWKMGLNRFEGYSSDAHQVIYGMHLKILSLPLEIFFDQLQEGFLHES